MVRVPAEFLMDVALISYEICRDDYDQPLCRISHTQHQNFVITIKPEAEKHFDSNAILLA
jgi:hypothetical protein